MPPKKYLKQEAAKTNESAAPVSQYYQKQVLNLVDDKLIKKNFLIKSPAVKFTRLSIF